jgi:RNA polymerase sigma-70 factor (ECF subfamily)
MIITSLPRILSGMGVSWKSIYFRAMNPSPKASLVTLKDDELVRLTLGGDREAYRTIVERYQNRLLATARDIVKTRQDAEDVVQETFVKAFLSLGQFKGQSSFYTWLYRICFNMAIDIRRKAGRRGGTHLEYKEYTGVNRSGNGDSGTPGATSFDSLQAGAVEGPHDALARKELGRKIQEVLGELSEEHRAVITLREIDGLDYEEIAKAIGVPKGTVMSRLFYARKALQKALSEYAPAIFSVHDEREEESDPSDMAHSARAKAR